MEDEDTQPGEIQPRWIGDIVMCLVKRARDRLGSEARAKDDEGETGKGAHIMDGNP
jgi:hypothetical protein